VNKGIDKTPNGRQTVTVNSPPAKESALPSGDYVISSWTSTRLDSNAYQVQLELLRAV
jgi:hypothetical protein